MQRNVGRKIVVTSICSFMRPRFILFLMLAMSSEAARAAGNDAGKIRIYAALDNSGSMRQSNRFRQGIGAMELWVEALEPQANLTIELLVAADHVVHQGTFLVRDEGERARLLDRLHELQPERVSKTVFRQIDEEVAALVRQHTRPDERFGVLFVTDGRSDEPATDLRLQDLGDQVLFLGHGLYAAASGAIPAQDAITGLANNQASLPRRGPARSHSKYRQLLAPSIVFGSLSALHATVRQRFFGGVDPLWVSAGIENTSEIAREVRIETRAPDGMTAQVVPTVATLGENKTMDLKIEVAVASDISDSMALIARTPDGNTVETTLRAEITVKSWFASNWPFVGGCTAFGIALLGVFLIYGRRAWFIVALGKPEHGLYIRSGEAVPLNTADPAVPPGVWLKRRWGGLWLRTDEDAIRVGGVPLQPGREVRYRLRTPIDAGAASIVLDRRSHRQATARPIIIAGASDGITACDELL